MAARRSSAVCRLGRRIAATTNQPRADDDDGRDRDAPRRAARRRFEHCRPPPAPSRRLASPSRRARGRAPTHAAADLRGAFARHRMTSALKRGGRLARRFVIVLGLFLHLRREYRLRRSAGERRGASEQFVGENAPCVDVRAMIRQRIGRRLLRRHIGRRAEGHAERGDRFAAARASTTSQPSRRRSPSPSRRRRRRARCPA